MVRLQTPRDSEAELRLKMMEHCRECPPKQSERLVLITLEKTEAGLMVI